MAAGEAFLIDVPEAEGTKVSEMRVTDTRLYGVYLVASRSTKPGQKITEYISKVGVDQEYAACECPAGQHAFASCKTYGVCVHVRAARRRHAARVWPSARHEDVYTWVEEKLWDGPRARPDNAVTDPAPATPTPQPRTPV